MAAAAVCRNRLADPEAAGSARVADKLRARTQEVWDRFYGLGHIWQRSGFLKSLRAKLAFVLLSKLYRQMYANTGIATDSARVQRSARRARWLARFARRLFVSAPMPALREPRGAPRMAPRRIPVSPVP